MDKVIIIKETPKGFVSDTVYSVEDTIALKLNQETTISIPDKEFTVHTIPEKDNLETIGLWVAIIAGIITLIYTLVSIRKLFSKNEDAEKQIAELIKQTAELVNHNKLYEKRIRMLVKPRIWSNGGNVFPAKNEWGISIDNKGEEAVIDSITVIGGDVANAKFKLYGFPMNIEKGGHLRITGESISKNPNDIQLTISIKYRDLEDYGYETTFNWKGGATTFLETKEY